jgi:pyruvate/2-oxoglutarate dehydrogenase complex dihydrolipoamide acyltransferase (E2) component
MEGAQMESLQNIQAQEENPSTNGSVAKESKSEFQELGELFSPRELQNVREHGGNLFQPIVNEDPNHRLFLQDSDTETEGGTQDQPPSQSNPTPAPAPSPSLAGVYKHVRSNPTTSPGIQIVNKWYSTSLSAHTPPSASSSHLPPSKSQGCSNPPS